MRFLSGFYLFLMAYAFYVYVSGTQLSKVYETILFSTVVFLMPLLLVIVGMISTGFAPVGEKGKQRRSNSNMLLLIVGIISGSIFIFIIMPLLLALLFELLS
jgi:hypothetical protein